MAIGRRSLCLRRSCSKSFPADFAFSGGSKRQCGRDLRDQPRALNWCGRWGSRLQPCQFHQSRDAGSARRHRAYARKEREPGPSDQLNEKATAYFKAVFKRPEAQNITISAQFRNEGGLSVSVSGVSSLKTGFLGIMGLETLQISANAVAVSNSGGLGCALALNRTIGGAITAQGSTTVVLDGCSLFDNSNSGTALTVGGSAKISALSVSVVGNISGYAGVTATQGVSANANCRWPTLMRKL